MSHGLQLQSLSRIPPAAVSGHLFGRARQVGADYSQSLQAELRKRAAIVTQQELSVEKLQARNKVKWSGHRDPAGAGSRSSRSRRSRRW